MLTKRDVFGEMRKFILELILCYRLDSVSIATIFVKYWFFIMRGFCLILSLLLLVACGQKGGLYLPEKKPPVNPHSQP